VSITVKEVVDNAVLMVIPGAMAAHPGSGLFWGSLAIALVLAAILVFPVNRWLIGRGRGRGHAVVHRHHHSARRRSVLSNAAFHSTSLAGNLRRS